MTKGSTRTACGMLEEVGGDVSVTLRHVEVVRSYILLSSQNPGSKRLLMCGGWQAWECMPCSVFELADAKPSYV